MEKINQKQELRAIYLKQRNEIEAKQRKEASQKIKETLYATLQFLRADHVFLYVSYQSEVETKTWIPEIIAMGKLVAVPKVIGKEMEFFEISCLEDLVVGFRGILEPKTVGKEPILPKKEDVLLLPGVIFDTFGGRIGYGGGYYDRYINQVEQQTGQLPYLLGLAYQKQLYFGNLPLEPQDKKVDKIITEQAVIVLQK